MKKTTLVLIGVAVFTVIGYLAFNGRNATKEQAAAQIDSTESVEVASSNTTANLHFENLHVNPQLHQ